MYACIRKTAGEFCVGVCEQEHQGSEIDAAYPSAGCSTVAVSWTRRSSEALAFSLQIARKKIEPTSGLEPLT